PGARAEPEDFMARRRRTRFRYGDLTVDHLQQQALRPAGHSFDQFRPCAARRQLPAMDLWRRVPWILLQRHGVRRMRMGRSERTRPIRAKPHLYPRRPAQHVRPSRSPSPRDRGPARSHRRRVSSDADCPADGELDGDGAVSDLGVGHFVPAADSLRAGRNGMPLSLERFSSAAARIGVRRVSRRQYLFRRAAHAYAVRSGDGRAGSGRPERTSQVASLRPAITVSSTAVLTATIVGPLGRSATYEIEMPATL